MDTRVLALMSSQRNSDGDDMPVESNGERAPICVCAYVVKASCEDAVGLQFLIANV